MYKLGNEYQSFYDCTAVSPECAEEDLNRVALCTWAFICAIKRHLFPPWEDEEDFKKELFEKLPEEQAEKIIDAAHHPNHALQLICSNRESTNAFPL